MKIDDLLKKIHALKDLRHAIGIVKAAQLDKADSSVSQMKQEGQQAMQTVPIGQRSNWRHGGIDTQKLKSAGIVSHIIKIPGINTPYHYQIDVDMKRIHGKDHPFTVHKVKSDSGQAIESDNKPHKNIASAVKSLMRHASENKWSDQE